MFPLLKYFSLTSAVAITAVTATLTYYHWHESRDDLVDLAGRSNIALVRVFSNSIWPRYSEEILNIDDLTVDEDERQKIVNEMDAVIRGMVAGLPILKVKIYTMSSMTVYSSEPSQIGESRLNDPVLQSVMEKKQPVFEMIFHDTFFSFDGALDDRTIVETYLPMLGPDGEVEGVFELYRDVTPEAERLAREVISTAIVTFLLLLALYVALLLIVRRASGVLKEQYSEIEHSQKRFLDFAEASSDWLWETDASHRFIFMTSQVEDVTGVPVEFHLGKTREEISGVSAQTPNWNEFKQKLQNQEPFKKFEYLRTGIDGEPQYLNISGVPVYDSAGHFTGYRGVGNDVTAQNKALLRANEAEGLLRDSINALNDAFAIYDTEDRLVMCNERYREYFPRSREFIVPGATFEDILRKGVARGEYVSAIGREEEWIKERLDWHWNGGEPLEQCLADGRWLRIAERKTEAGATVGFRVDVTELKHAQHAAEAASAAKSEFLASMSHEIRTPMTGVLGFADMLLDDNLPEESAAKVSKIKEVASSLLVIINDILDISKMDAGKLEIEMVDFRPAALANDVIQLFYQTCPAEKKDKLQISATISDDFPDAVRADPTRLRQVLVNLMGNAVKFTDNGSVILNCAHDGDKQQLKFEITDTGIGIPEETQAKLFGEFVQADASISRTYQGTGLGLSICKRLVELMGGEIGVDSTFTQGSRFWFTLPYEFVAEGAVIVEEDRSNSKRFAGSRALEILIAEDNEINQVIIRAILEKMGHHPTFANDGSEAVSALKAQDYDLILMDVRMPVMSGPDATRQIRKLPGFKSMIPIIALTADVMAENKQSYFEAGMNDCVGKPINQDELATAMNKVLGEVVNMQLETKAE